MNRTILLTVGLAVLGGCATTPPPAPRVVKHWAAVRTADRFTDQESCTVKSTQQEYADLFRIRLTYHPYVEKRGDDVRVGVMGGGRFKIPVGRVQLRVDGNEAWTIETAETPVDIASTSASQLAFTMQAASPNLTPEGKAALERAAALSAGTMDRAMSPFTAATGEKARTIVAQMRGGTQLIYRTLGANQPGSSEGKVLLGDQFRAALAECGL